MLNSAGYTPGRIATVQVTYCSSSAGRKSNVLPALMAKEFNYIINPAQADMTNLLIGEIEEYSFDRRFVR
jgi:hypothetical protein